MKYEIEKALHKFIKNNKDAQNIMFAFERGLITADECLFAIARLIHITKYGYSEEN